MISHRITSSDIVRVTGFSRHKLRNFLKELPGYSDNVQGERIAREYSRHDLVIITICCALEDQCGLRREVIAALASDIRQAVTTPHAVASTARLVICVTPISVQYRDGPVAIERGTVLPLNDILRRIDAHVGGAYMADSEGQLFLDLGPVAVASPRHFEKTTEFTLDEHAPKGKMMNVAR